MTITNLTQTITNYFMKNEMFIVNLGIVRAFMVKSNCFSFKMLTFKQTKVQKVTILVTGERNMRILSTNINCPLWQCWQILSPSPLSPWKFMFVKNFAYLWPVTGTFFITRASLVPQNLCNFKNSPYKISISEWISFTTIL